MSHLVKIELEIKEMIPLEKACKRLGLTMKKNQQTFKWYGREDASCDHAISIPGAKYEIGVSQNRATKNYELQTDFWDKGVAAKIGVNGGLLKQAYTVEKAKWEATKKGYSCREIQTAKGIQLRITVQ